jgi:hypothetical protein
MNINTKKNFKGEREMNYHPAPTASEVAALWNAYIQWHIVPFSILLKLMKNEDNINLIENTLNTCDIVFNGVRTIFES